VAGQLIILLPVLLFVLIKRVPIKEWIPFRRIGIPTIFMTILFTLLLLPLVSCLNLLSLFFVTNHLVNTQQGLQENSFWLNLLVLALIPAVLEEFTFRGIFYRAYREKGVLMAAIGCGVTFGLMHMNFNQFFYALVLGIAFCLLLEATGSIYATITAHFVLNGWSVVMMEVQKWLLSLTESLGQTTNQQTELTQDQMLIMFGVIAVIATVTTCIAGCVLVWIAKHNGRLECLKSCLRRKPTEAGEEPVEAGAKPVEAGEEPVEAGEEPVEAGEKPVGAREKPVNRTFITPIYVIAGVICIIYMLRVQ